MNTFSNKRPTLFFSRVKNSVSSPSSETINDSTFDDMKVDTALGPGRDQIDKLRRAFARRYLVQIPRKSVHAKNKSGDHRKKSLRTLPLLDVYEFQTLTDYAEYNLIFTPHNTLICTPITLLYEDYLKFFYQTRYNGTESFEEFENTLRKVKSKDKKTKRFRGLITKYQFARALQHVAKEFFNVTLEKLRTRELVLQGVSLKNPNSTYLKDIVYRT